MAIAPTKPATKTVRSGQFEFDTDMPVPTPVRGARSGETADKLAAMPFGASYLEPVTVPDTIKGDVERDKAFKEIARTTSNRVSGVIRRFKKNNENTEFTIRTVNDPVLGQGVRVWRVEAATA